MNVIDWKVELHQLFDMFERQSTISLVKIKQSREASGRAFDENFRKYFLKMSTRRLGSSFDIVQFGQLDDHQLQMSPKPTGPMHGKQTTSNDDSLNERGKELEIGNNADEKIDNVDSSDDEDDVFRGFEMQTINDPIVEQGESNASHRSNYSNGGALSDEDDVEIDVKREIKVENVEDEEVDLPLIEFDPTEYNRSLSAVNDATVANSLSNPSQPSIASKTKGRSTHKKISKCMHCDFSCRLKWSLKRHQLIHDGRKLMGAARDPKDGTYKCAHCDRQFTELNYLSVHVTKLHKNIRRQYNCLRCMRPFARKIERDRHEIGCPKRRYECYLCKKYFTEFVTQMQGHMRTHSGAKPFQCATCNRHFRIKITLERHLKKLHSCV